MGSKLNKFIHGVQAVGKAADKALGWLDETDPAPRRRKRNLHSSKTTPQSIQERENPVIDGLVDRVIQSIREFNPIRKPSNELTYQTMLFSSLAKDYVHLKMGQKIGNNEIDATIDKIGIEVKMGLKKADADRLFGQIDAFLQHIERIIVILYQPNPQWQTYFNDKIARHNWQKAVRVLPIAS